MSRIWAYEKAVSPKLEEVTCHDKAGILLSQIEESERSPDPQENSGHSPNVQTPWNSIFSKSSMENIQKPTTHPGDCSTHSHEVDSKDSDAATDPNQSQDADILDESDIEKHPKLLYEVDLNPEPHGVYSWKEGFVIASSPQGAHEFKLKNSPQISNCHGEIIKI